MKRLFCFLCFISLVKVYAQQSADDILFEQTYEKYELHNYSETFPIFSQLANNGYSRAYGYMGLAYELGEGVEKNTAQMCKWYDLAIKSGQNWCGWRLGKYLADLDQHYLALDALMIAAKSSGFKEEASLLLGEMFENGLGVDKNIKNAIEYYKNAALGISSGQQALVALERLGASLYEDSDFKDAHLQ